MRARAGVIDMCTFAVTADIPSAAHLPYDSALVDGVEELAMVIRNEPDICGNRGLPNRETWTLIASPSWTASVRPDMHSWWDKHWVSTRMVRAFASFSGTTPG